MREFKFGAWRESDNQMITENNMYSPRALYFSGKTFYTYEKMSTFGGGDGFRYEDNLILMQYTGLKDAINKNEIYEHDIINLLGVGFLKVEWDYKHTGWICLDKHYKKRNLADVLLNGGIRVGNIYENPDLLKKI